MTTDSSEDVPPADPDDTIQGEMGRRLRREYDELGNKRLVSISIDYPTMQILVSTIQVALWTEQLRSPEMKETADRVRKLAQDLSDLLPAGSAMREVAMMGWEEGNS